MQPQQENKRLKDQGAQDSKTLANKASVQDDM
jgi:hypothetical protein